MKGDLLENSQDLAKSQETKMYVVPSRQKNGRNSMSIAFRKDLYECRI